MRRRKKKYEESEEIEILIMKRMHPKRKKNVYFVCLPRFLF